jgi:hypothetical protein
MVTLHQVHRFGAGPGGRCLKLGGTLLIAIAMIRVSSKIGCSVIESSYQDKG